MMCDLPGTRASNVLLLLSLTPVMAGCLSDPAPAAGDLTTTIDTVGGVVRVVNSGTAPEWQLTLETSIGPKSLAVGGGGPEEFGKVTTAMMGPGDEVYVGDSQYLEIRVFGLDGEHRRTFGRDGEGPGEFPGHINSLAWVRDRLLAIDLIGGRINEFSSAGEPLGQRVAPGYWGGTGPGEGLAPVGGDEAYSQSLVPGPTGLSFVHVGQNSAGETGDTIHPPEDPWDQSITCEYNNGWLWFFENIYGPKLALHPGPGGTMYQARTDIYRIALTRGADTLRIIERTLPVEELSDEEWAAVADEFAAGLRERRGASCEPPRPVRPATKPFINKISIAPDGRLWVEAFGAAGNRWDVFDPEGRLLGSVPLVEWKEYSVPAFGTDHLLAIRQDSLELDHVDVWRIERDER